MAEEAVVVLQGPRTVGKSVLLAELAKMAGVEVIDLDDPATAEAVSADPALVAGSAAPVCIDEYQHAPELLGAIKSELNRGLRPGRFVLTGSTRSEAVPELARYLAGRIHLLSVLPFSQGEIDGTREDLLEVLARGDFTKLTTPSVSTTTREQYIGRVVRGGFPLALARGTDAARVRWFDDYVTTVLERDVAVLAQPRQRRQLPSLLRHLASQTGQLLNISAAAEAAGLDRGTATGYLAILESVFLVRELPAWGTTLRRRSAVTPKVHLVDTGLAARLLGLTAVRLARVDPTALTELGHLLETFVVGEILKQASWLDGIARWGHWRTYDGDEVDLVVELDDGRVVAFEVKAGSRIRDKDLNSLRRLREATGEAFVAGVALYTGVRSYRAGDRLFVMPIDRLWTTVHGEPE